MKLKRFLGICLAAILVFACSGCSLNFFSVESLMGPPMQSGKNGEVQAAFNKLMSGKTVQLRTPNTGDYQTSFVLFDINSDGNEEALVFYTDSSVDASVRMALLEYVNGIWVISADIKGSGSSIYDLSFKDLNQDGVYEILVGWSLYDSKTAAVCSVYEVSSGENGVFVLKTLANEYYNTKSLVDFNGDGIKDLLLVYIDDTGEVIKPVLRCFSLSPNKELIKYCEVPLDSSVFTIAKIQTDTVTVDSRKYNRVFIDCGKTDNTIFTEMIYWEPEENIPVRAIEDPASTTLRNSKIYCRDIDGDGILEIPANIKMYGDANALTVKVDNVPFSITMLTWINSFGDKSEGNINTVFNPLDSYIYRLTRYGQVTARYDTLRNAMVFCLWDEENQLIKDELLSIAYRKFKDADSFDGKELCSTKDGSFFYNITSYGEEIGITDEGVSSSFILID